MNKRDVVLSLLDNNNVPAYVPAAFFLHFDPSYHRGQAAVDKHLEYFHYTDMDFVKIQYENSFPYRPEIRKPDDWAKIPLYGKDFYDGQLGVVEGLVKAAKKEALVIMTLYSPFMCAGHTASSEALVAHIHSDPEKVKRGMEIITDSLMIFVKECIRLGVDGFYTSTQGGEVGRVDDPALFDQCIRPYDLALMEEANRSCIFNILHVCDYARPYADISRYVDYPGHVVNVNLELVGRTLKPQEVANMFGRPYMGGIERLGVIAKGSPNQVREAAESVLKTAPDHFLLAADCTVPGDTSWDNLKTAIQTAHEFSCG
jgi:uroporphyrinogen decarboxylase